MSPLLSIVAAVVAAATTVPAAVPTTRCYADWSDAAALVRQEGLVGVDELSRLARVKLDSEVVKTTLCQEGERYIYRVVLKVQRGALRVVIVDARQPFAP